MSTVSRTCAWALALAAAVTLTTTAQTPPPQGRGGAQGGRGGAPPQGGGGLLASAGPADKPPVDAAAADRGRTVYAAECINCHGTQSRGTDKGPNLVRSVTVLRDRYGSLIGPFLKQGHQLQSGKPATGLTDAQITDLANFLRQRVNDSLRGSPLFKPQNVLTGDPKAGATYFNGEGKCASCHSPTGNLAGVGTKYEVIDLQQRMLFPRTGRGRGAAAAAVAVTVAVTPASGATVSGTLLQMDDFDVVLRDSAGAIHSFKRTPGLKVVKTDPMAAHIALLDTITDKQMHDVVAYLETLK